MMNFLFRLFLTFNATSLILVVYLVKESVVLNSLHPRLELLPAWVSYSFYFLIPVFLTLLSLVISKVLPTDNIGDGQEGAVKEVEQANNAYLPTYLGYFFVALGVTGYTTLLFIFILLFVFTFLSQSLYFNPLFLLFGYHFYYLTTSSNIKVFIITKRNLKNPSKISFKNLKRINDFTFIDKGK